MVCFLVAACAGEPPPASHSPAPRIPFEPNPIVVIVVDTLRADHLSTYGYFRDTSPFIDSFADSAILFENAFTPIATTLPAHVSLWTGKYPLQTGVLKNGSKFKRSSTSGVSFFAEMLKGIGYQTAAFVSAGPVKAKTGMDIGMDTYDEPEGSQRPSDETTDNTLEWLDSTAQAPFFLWVHYFDPHNPYEPPEPYKSKFTSRRDMSEFLLARGLPAPIHPALAWENNFYDGEIAFVDAQVRRLVEALQAKGWYDEATIVFTADHGEGLGQHNYLRHGRIYNETLRIPLIIKFPKSSGLNGQRRTNMVSLIDIVPTLASTLSLPLAGRQLEQLAGVNALDPAQEREYIFAQRTFRERPMTWGPGQKFALLKGNWKYHHSTHVDDELYDLENDPSEIDNRLFWHPWLADEMKDLLLTLVAEYSSESGNLNVLEDMSPESLRELRALGYIQ
jgi:arylsulfatase A-like enzyme